MSNKLEQIDNLPSRIKIASILRKAIFSGEFEEGTELLLTHIAAQVGVSRTPVREAFQMLQSEGLLELRMNKGAIVKGITSKFIIDHYEMRILLEGEAVVRAINRNMDTSDLIKEQNEIALDSSLSIERLHQYNQIFHTSIWKVAGNQKLYSYLQQLWNGLSFGKTVSEQDHFKISFNEHEEILNYITKKQPELAKLAMDKHIHSSMNNILNSFNFNR